MASALLKHFNRLPRILRMSIRSKLLITLMTFGAAAVAGTAWIGYFNSKRSLTETAMNQLTGIRRSRAYHVESYFRTIRKRSAFCRFKQHLDRQSLFPRLTQPADILAGLFISPQTQSTSFPDPSAGGLGLRGQAHGGSRRRHSNVLILS